MAFATSSHDGVRIYYEGEGPPLVMHHGGGSSLERWRELGYVDALRDEFLLILLDARGHGRSDKPTTPDAYPYERWVWDVVAVLDDLGIEQAHFFGYSLGGLVGFRIPLHAPERFHSLSLGGSHPGDLRDFWQGQNEIFKDGGKLFLERAAASGREIPEAEIEILRSGAHAAIVTALRDEPDVTEQLASISIPLLLFVGGDDSIGDTGRKAPEAARLIPGATLLMYAGLGHNDVVQRPALVVPFVRAFLGGLSAGR
jgi:pimeloyl-ACP methyl ester carboxylesterase